MILNFYLIVLLFDEKISKGLVNRLVIGTLDSSQVGFYQTKMIDLSIIY